jgi:general secretion pathway protein C
MISAILKKYIKVLEFILIALIAIVFVLIVHDNFVKPSLSTSNITQGKAKPRNNDLRKYASTDRQKPRDYYKPILVNNIFGLKNVGITDNLKPGPRDPGEAPETKLNMELIATIIDINQSEAVLKNLDNEKTNGYFVGEEVDIYKSEKIKISRVDNCKVIIERRSGFETIKCKTMDVAAVSKRPKSTKKSKQALRRSTEREESDPVMDEGIKEVGDNQFEVDQDLLDDLLEDMNEIMSEVRVIPNDEGLRLFGMRPKTFFYKIGLRNGDTLNSINEVELTDVSNALGIFEQLRGQPNFTINLTRRKQKMTFEYNVK